MYWSMLRSASRNAGELSVELSPVDAPCLARARSFSTSGAIWSGAGCMDLKIGSCRDQKNFTTDCRWSAGAEARSTWRRTLAAAASESTQAEHTACDWSEAVDDAAVAAGAGAALGPGLDPAPAPRAHPLMAARTTTAAPATA